MVFDRVLLGALLALALTGVVGVFLLEVLHLFQHLGLLQAVLALTGLEVLVQHTLRQDTVLLHVEQGVQTGDHSTGVVQHGRLLHVERTNTFFPFFSRVVLLQPLEGQDHSMHRLGGHHEEVLVESVEFEKA